MGCCDGFLTSEAVAVYWPTGTVLGSRRAGLRVDRFARSVPSALQKLPKTEVFGVRSSFAMRLNTFKIGQTASHYNGA
jgi:hypothetical protein